MDLITTLKDERLRVRGTTDEPANMDEARGHISFLRERLEATERMWSEDRAAVKDWAAASDAIGELYEILGITKDSAGFEDGFTKIVAATRAALSRAEEAERLAEERAKSYRAMSDSEFALRAIVARINVEGMAKILRISRFQPTKEEIAQDLRDHLMGGKG
jgi:hypothetical protein